MTSRYEYIRLCCTDIEMVVIGIHEMVVIQMCAYAENEYLYVYTYMIVDIWSGKGFGK